MAKKEEFQGFRSRYWKIMKTIIIVIPFLMLSTAIYFSGTTLAFISIANNNTGHFLGGIADDSFLESIQESYQILLYGLLCLFGFGILICFAYFGFYKKHGHISWKLFFPWTCRIFKLIRKHKHPIHIVVLCFILILLLGGVSVIVFLAQSSGLYQAIWFIGLRLSSLDEPLNIRNILIGVFGGISLLILAWRSASADRTVQLKEDEHIQTRYDNASVILATLLDKKSHYLHLRAIATLRDIAIDNNQFTQRCINDICKCNEWMKDYAGKFISSYESNSSAFLYGNNKVSNEPFVERELSKTFLATFRGITLYQARLSQEALKAVRDILEALANNKENKHLNNINFSDKMLCGIDLSNTQIKEVNFYKACMISSNLGGANLEGAIFKKADLRKSRLEGANLSGSIMTKSDLSEASLYRAIMDKVNLHDCTLAGASMSRVRLHKAVLTEADLTCADLRGARLSYAQMHGANFTGANLEWANLSHASLVESNLEGSILQSAFLQGANLSGANLCFCIMLDCNLYGTSLQGSNSTNIIYSGIASYAYNNLKSQGKKFLQSIKSFNASLQKVWVNEWFLSHTNHFPEVLSENQFNKRKNNIIKKIKMFREPAEINELENNSLIKLHENEWKFKKGTKTKVKKFYIDFISNSDGYYRYRRMSFPIFVKTSVPEHVRKQIPRHLTAYNLSKKAYRYNIVIIDIMKIAAVARQRVSRTPSNKNKIIK